MDGCPIVGLDGPAADEQSRPDRRRPGLRRCCGDSFGHAALQRIRCAPSFGVASARNGRRPGSTGKKEWRRLTDDHPYGGRFRPESLRTLGCVELSDEQPAPGIRSVTAPLRDGSGRVIAALNVNCHAAETSVERLVEEYLPLLQIAGDISADFARVAAVPQAWEEPLPAARTSMTGADARHASSKASRSRGVGMKSWSRSA
ncbi:IclR family transcriptional regulator C-terminal domain-containing protein [Streptomyces sp. T21Q-yed]|nr:IclR family transcriptional regulator C-terminal domain-containing protein [Streptomyces sp. T21Q-yed]MDF3139762.1 IclR family transcriptional regulator C-terminal domain-containing protein [Streptomyces sp. T21Q-yed]WDF42508.1 IclR family transcriptional regulator C-terminal domain-containing protein [Streptomyces sp. T12]